MKTTNRIKRYFVAVIIICSAAVMSSCSNDEPTFRPSISIGGEAPVYYNTPARWVRINAIGDWVISVIYDNNTDDWCVIAPLSGSGNKDVVMTLKPNESSDIRTATIDLMADRTKSSLLIEQLDQSYGDITSPTPPTTPPTSPTKVDKMTSTPNWMELPATRNYGNSAVVNHSLTTGTGTAVNTIRNYTMLYDTVQRVAYWVAYPLAGNYLGSVDRTNKWAYDPKVPNAYQPDMRSGLKETNEAGYRLYDRGHQLPSADRTVSVTANAQTFFFTNMTAQDQYFNQRIWATLETNVRTWAATADTLYVVTGAVLGNPIRYTKDNSKQNVAVPSHYYKALLWLKGGAYKSIGFWYENRTYSYNKVTMQDAKSVKNLEQLTGFTFFPSLTDQSIKTQLNGGDWNIPAN